MADQITHLPPPVPARIPQYIGRLNALAVNAGLTVELKVAPYSNSPEIRLWSNWRGSQAAFLALVQPVASYRLPLSHGRLNIPGGAGYYGTHALLSGEITVTGVNVLFEIDFGPSEFTIADAAGVEIVSYADETLYHGDPAAMMALGIERSRLPLQKKAVRSGWGTETQRWKSRRQPDGSIVYRVESPAALRRRRAQYEMHSPRVRKVLGMESEKPSREVSASHLRLVIDNTREG